MSVKMIVDFRRKPSLARRQAVARERAAELDRVVKEELIRWTRIQAAVDYSTVDPTVVVADPEKMPLGMTYYNPRTGIASVYVAPPGSDTLGEKRKREDREATRKASERARYKEKRRRS